MLSLIVGILMVIGSFLTMQGKIFYSVAVYLIVDFCWVMNAFQKNDFSGVIFTFIGFLFCLIAFLKMQTGILKKFI